MSIAISWDQPSLSGDRLQAYASLLRLQRDGQIDQKSIREISTETYTKEYEDDDADTIAINDLSSFDEDRLKESFQDRVAELVANVKGGYHVAATLLFTTRQGMKLIAAKNEGLDKKDEQFLQRLQDLLRGISATQAGHHDGSRQALWEEILLHSDARIREWILDFQSIATKFKQKFSETWHDNIRVQLLRDNILALLDASSKEFKAEIVETAHAIWDVWNDEEFIEACANQPDLAHKLRFSIGFLGRLRIAYNVLIRAAERLTGFDEFTISPLTWSKHSSKKKWKEKNKCWTLNKTFQSLSLPLNDASVKELCRPKWDKYKLARKFDEIQKQSPQIHAEIQLILYAAQQDPAEGTTTGYIGCSKKSCFLCWEFLKTYGTFRTRTTHGKIYNLWVVPAIEHLPDQTERRISNAVQSVEQSIKIYLHTKKEKGGLLAKESTVGGSSIATKVEFHGSHRTFEQIVDYLSMQRKEARTQKSSEITSDPSVLSQNPYEQEFLEVDRPQAFSNSSDDKGGECHWCESYTTNRCPYCNKDWYCNSTCASGSVFHRFECAGRALTTADYLERAVLEDKIPDDPQTLDDYGFSRCKAWNQKSHLLGLYGGLLKTERLSSAELDEWTRSGTLVKNIINKYMAISENFRGQYFPWFMRHQYLLDPATPIEDDEAQIKLLVAAFRNASAFLDPEDRDIHPLELEPAEKRDAFLFFAMAREHMRPSPTDSSDTWYKFGFCVCREEHKESSLGGLYSRLVSGNKFHEDYDKSLGVKLPRHLRVQRAATFEEFWHSYRDGTLSALMKKYGLEQDLHHFTNLESFLALRPGSTRPPVWRLRQYLEYNGTHVEIPSDVLAGAEAYGVTSDLNPREKMEMMTFYRKLWSQYDMDPLEMEEARCHGYLTEFAHERLRNLSPDVARLLEKLDLSNTPEPSTEEESTATTSSSISSSIPLSVVGLSGSSTTWLESLLGWG